MLGCFEEVYSSEANFTSSNKQIKTHKVWTYELFNSRVRFIQCLLLQSENICREVLCVAVFELKIFSCSTCIVHELFTNENIWYLTTLLMA